MNRLSLPKNSKEFEWKKKSSTALFRAYKFVKILMQQIMNDGKKKVMSSCESHRQLIILDHISNCKKKNCGSRITHHCYMLLNIMRE